MSRKNGRLPDRTPSFQFYAMDFIADRAVVAMTPLERGGYVMLLCHAWISDRPGWLPDDDRLLAALSGLGGHWSDCRDGVARAFSIRKGWWIQKRMVRERRVQLSYFRVKSAAGRVGAKNKWERKVDATAIRLPMAKDSASASASASASRDSKTLASPDSVHVARRRSRTEPRARPPAAGGFREGLIEELESSYPDRDVRLIADKVTERHRDEPFRNLNSALRGWVVSAQNRDIDRRDTRADDNDARTERILKLIAEKERANGTAH